MTKSICEPGKLRTNFEESALLTLISALQSRLRIATDIGCPELDPTDRLNIERIVRSSSSATLRQEISYCGGLNNPLVTLWPLLNRGRQNRVEKIPNFIPNISR
jgi:hypothetical protein